LTCIIENIYLVKVKNKKFADKLILMQKTNNTTLKTFELLLPKNQKRAKEFNTQYDNKNEKHNILIGEKK
jgi:hypothetical protein